MEFYRLLAILGVSISLSLNCVQAQTYKVLYNFGSNGGGPNDPIWSGIMAQSRGGNLYSTAPDTWTYGNGTAFKLTRSGDLTILHRFTGTDGLHTQSGLTLGTDGFYYGTTMRGGRYSYGTVFKMTDQGVVTTLHHFTGGADGGSPAAPPIEGIDGNFYGTTGFGGIPGGNGTIYKITRSGAFSTMHIFGFPTENPGYENGALVQGKDGYIYGTTFYGGSHGAGTIFRFATSGAFATLVTFDRTNGRNPYGPLLQASDGNFYGTASNGGSYDGGVLFRLIPFRSFTVLHHFTGGSDGNNQVGGLMQATDGYIYGTNNLGGANGWGVLFRVNTSGAFSVLHDFAWDSGASPQMTMLQHTDGTVYGETAVGGINNSGEGTFFSLNIGQRPFVRFLPEAKQVGHEVQFLGQGFKGTTEVSFNGTPAAFKVVADTFLTAIVPAGARSGFVTVTTPAGTLKSNKQFLVKPQITSIAPTSGTVGSEVVISGVSLAQTSTVTISGLPATFTVKSDKEVTAKVPAGAVSGKKVTLTTTGAPAYSPTTFTVTR